MRNSVRLFSVLALGSALLFSGSAGSMPPSRDAEEMLFKWCMSYFPDEEDGRLTVLPRPVQKLAPLVMEGMMAPPDLVMETQIAGKLPPDIERYQGTWIRPSADMRASMAVFVERLTSTEATITLVHERAEDRSGQDHENERFTLIWNGSEFAYRKAWSDGLRTMDLRISPSGHTMFLMWGAYPSSWPKNSDGSSVGEGWPACFISSKHY